MSTPLPPMPDNAAARTPSVSAAPVVFTPIDLGGGSDEGKLREEIIESQKSQVDLVKWKLISVAAVAAVSLGLGTSSPAPAEGARLLMCLVPLICIYVDFSSVHIMIRIITIGIYLKSIGNRYELFVSEIRKTGAGNPFIFEEIALYGSSLLIDVLIVGLGFVSIHEGQAITIREFYIVSAFVGLVATLALWFTYWSRKKEVERIAEEKKSIFQATKHEQK